MNRAAVVERARLGKPKRGPEHEVLLFPTIKTMIKTVTIPKYEYRHSCLCRPKCYTACRCSALTATRVCAPISSIST